ncbi:hypothetical protein GGX14DRAFT_393322 [Mycena pura]|uniref:Uncharacterized protein n=1 Tax=Mycena pura TaxID=153505 RepID=A0AAD6YH12_9AGAR|nr:hypothetical protein GGX14DRAFT_393322 [Mycena pura]
MDLSLNFCDHIPRPSKKPQFIGVAAVALHGGAPRRRRAANGLQDANQRHGASHRGGAGRHQAAARGGTAQRCTATAQGGSAWVAGWQCMILALRERCRAGARGVAGQRWRCADSAGRGREVSQGSGGAGRRGQCRDRQRRHA